MTKREIILEERSRLIRELRATYDWIAGNHKAIPYVQSLPNPRFVLWFRRNGQLAYSNKCHPAVYGDKNAEILFADIRGITAAQVAAELKARGL